MDSQFDNLANDNKGFGELLCDCVHSLVTTYATYCKRSCAMDFALIDKKYLI